MVRYSFIFLVFLAFVGGGSGVFASDPLTQKLLDFPGQTQKQKAAPTRDTRDVRGLILAHQLKLYQRIFAHQDAGDWKKADQLISKLKDRRLMGYVYQQRYLHPTAYTSTYAELQNWMSLYSDHAGAMRVYNLARRKGAGGLTSPKIPQAEKSYEDLPTRRHWIYDDGPERSEAQRQNFIELSDLIKEKIRSERPTQALGVLRANRSRLNQLDYDRLRARIAGSYMHEGKLAEASKQAQAALKTSGLRVPLAAWVAGLSAWRQGRPGEAAKYFEMAASSPYANPWTKSGAAFWASRSHMRGGNFGAVSLWLNRAASEPHTFYGLIAKRALSRPLEFEWEKGSLSKSHKQELAKYPAGVRGLGLLEIKKYDLAAGEFEQLEHIDSGPLKRALIRAANEINHPGLAWRSVSVLKKAGEADIPLEGFYPLMQGIDHHPATEQALLLAVVRQESKFNPRAGNPSGASGLMQLMPATAGGVVGQDVYDEAGGQEALYDGDFNIQTGRKYINVLFENYIPNRNLFELLIAWNAGPGNLQRWKQQFKDIDDPILFIETIPVAETRAFVERVMTNYWIYRDRLGLETPSLDAVAQGNAPIYSAK